MTKPQVQVKYTNEIARHAGLRYATAGSLAVDLVATKDFTVTHQGSVANDCGFTMKLPAGYGAVILPRSGLGSVLGIELANSVGLVDTDYHGQVIAVVTVKQLIHRHTTVEDFEKAFGSKLVPNLATVHDSATNKDIVIGAKFVAGDRIAQMLILPIPQAEFIEVEEFTSYGTRDGGFGSTGVKAD